MTIKHTQKKNPESRQTVPRRVYTEWLLSL